ncbi:MAG TPA: DegT/DnrJ/EryC1/StrS family aminotransferase [Terriglobales bacterium]|nr:DegT/DnrJ/EryC1/StrS family aminotransferase [Terriglobales bacterium]
MAMPSPIPFLDLVTPHRELQDDILAVVRQALSTAAFTNGPMLLQFETAFAEFCGTQHCIGVSSGTDALRFALLAAGVGPGDSVLTAPNSFVATAEAISQTGAVPEFVDVDPRTCNLDVTLLRAYLETCCIPERHGSLVSQFSGRRVAAIVPVHLYGQPADMDPILELAQRHGLMVIEDACQAHGALYFSHTAKAWLPAGSVGRAAAFSFYPGKNLGACGEAGAVTTNDDEIARQVRMLRDHGQVRKYEHVIEGYNGRMDAIQAGILFAKLRRLQEWNRQRRAAATRYRELFAGCPALMLPFELEYARSNYHLFVIRIQERDTLLEYLGEAGIGAMVHYPLPIHLQAAFRHLGYKPGDFPVAERLAAEVLSLPMYPHLTLAEQERVAETIRAFLEARGAASQVAAAS